jgi:DNA invertase Pin-like site-specific DNA recombinase
MQSKLEYIREQLMSGKKIYDLPLKVTSYERVSTDDIKQQSSLANQILYFDEKIKSIPNWTHVKGYVDEGISGTSIGKRIFFQQMIADAKIGKFDLIMTKSVQRFARDVVDTVQTVRDLLQCNVGVYFEDMNMLTFDNDIEFRLSIMAAVAQQESMKISENVKWGYQVTMKSGKRHGATPPIGYLFNNENNGYFIDPKLAPMVRTVFQMYANNDIGVRKLGLKLAEMGYLNAKNKPYSSTTLKRMIEHPVYYGCIVNGRSYKPLYRADKIVAKEKNEWIIHEDHDRVPPLVSKEIWEKANYILSERHDKMEGVDTSTKDSLGGGRYAYSRRILCANHNTNYVHTVGKWYTVDGNTRTVSYWRCGKYSKYGRQACNSPLLYTKDLNAIIRKIFINKVGMLQSEKESLKSVIDAILSPDNLGQDIASLNEQRATVLKKKERLLDGFTNGVVKATDYKTMSVKLDAQIEELDEKIKDTTHIQNSTDIIKKSHSLMDEVAASANLENDEVIEELVRAFVKKIIVAKNDDQHYELQVFLYNQGDPIAFDIGEKDSSFLYRTDSSMIQKRRILERILISDFVYNTPPRFFLPERDKQFKVSAYLII